MPQQIKSIDVTKTVYTVQDFVSWQESQGLELRPYFQRGSVWTARARSFLIDTLLRGYPVPVIYLQNKRNIETLATVRHVIDGQQRLRAVLSFVRPELIPLEANETPVRISRTHNRDLAGATFADLSNDLKSRILDAEFSVHVLPSDLPDATLLELFARLNSTGEKLNDQELRNAEYHGEFKTLAYRLAYENVATWEGWQLFSPREFSKMRDVEFVSELMLLSMSGIQAKSKAQLDTAYKQFDDDFPEADSVSSIVRRVLAHMDEANTPKRDVLKSQSWAYAVFSVLAEGDGTRPAGSLPRVPAIRRALVHLDERLREVRPLPEALQKALRGASTDRSSRQTRTTFFRDIMAEF